MKKKAPSVTYDSQNQAAAALNISIDRLRSAKRQGCPAFRNGRIHGAELTAWITAHNTPAASAPESAGPLPTGAPANLLALEQAASRLWNDYEAARKSGDPEQAVIFRRWLDCSEQLRKHDKDVSASRRVGQEMVSRAEVEAIFKEILDWWAVALRTNLLGSAAGAVMRATCPNDIWEVLDQIAHRGLFDAVANVKSWAKHPQWLIEAAENNLRHYFNKEYRTEGLEARVQLLAALENMGRDKQTECLQFILERTNLTLKS